MNSFLFVICTSDQQLVEYADSSFDRRELTTVVFNPMSFHRRSVLAGVASIYFEVVPVILG